MSVSIKMCWPKLLLILGLFLLCMLKFLDDALYVLLVHDLFLLDVIEQL